MKLNYAVRFEDFQTLQPPFITRAGDNAGFKGVLVACGLIALLGVWCIAYGMGIPVGGFLIGLGFAAATAAYFYDKRSVTTKKEKYDRDLRDAHQRIHCRDQRVLELNENEFSLSCKCGSVTRPWAELTSFSENETHFAFNTKSGGNILPKSAFPSEAEVTEFRALVAGKLNHDKPVTSPHFDFACIPADYRDAYLLHTLKGGGWRRLAKGLATYCGVTYGALVIWRSLTTHNPAILCGLIGGLVGVPLLRIAAQRRRHYLGPLRVYFGDEGLHLQGSSGQSRTSWEQFAGYLENSKILLLYYNPRLYRIIPKRALTGQAANFRPLVPIKLAGYDYRNPVAVRPKLARSAQQVS